MDKICYNFKVSGGFVCWFSVSFWLMMAEVRNHLRPKFCAADSDLGWAMDFRALVGFVVFLNFGLNLRQKNFGKILLFL